MRKDGAARRTELLRKAVHVGSGFIALSLAWLTWQQALALALGALAFNALVLPRIGGRALLRESEQHRSQAFGILMYPLSVAILIVAFRNHLEFAAIGWALMAFGDGMASVVGSLFGRHRLPWNQAKSWEGVWAHVSFGGGMALVIPTLVFFQRQRPDASVLVQLAELPWADVALHAGPVLLLVALATSLVESIDSGIDDNLLVPLLGSGVAFVLLMFDIDSTDSGLPSRAATAAGACSILALGSWRLGKLTIIGSIGAAILGIVVAAGGGWGLFAALCAFFAIGVGVTRIGRGVKEARGIAEARGGRRGLGNVLANGGMTGLLAIAAVALGPAAVACGVAALATSAFDTVSSEIGKAFGRRTFLPTTLRSVPPGTEGAVSLEGTLAGFGGALVVALVAWLAKAPLTPLLVGLVVVAAFIGSTFESIVGALCHERGHRVQNDFMNFANTAVGAAAMAILLASI